MSSAVGSKDALRQVYKTANPRSVAKELKRLDAHCRRFVELSPFVVMGTGGAGGQDVSPRGGPPGFVKVIDENTLVLPDFPATTASIRWRIFWRTGASGCSSSCPALTRRCASTGGRRSIGSRFARHGDGGRRLPIAVIRVAVETGLSALRQGAHALRPVGPGGADRAPLPSMGQMLKDQISTDKPAETQEEMLVRYRETLHQSPLRAGQGIETSRSSNSRM